MLFQFNFLKFLARAEKFLKVLKTCLLIKIDLHGKVYSEELYFNN